MKKNRMILIAGGRSVADFICFRLPTIDRIAVRSEARKKEIPVVVIVPDAAKSGVRCRCCTCFTDTAAIRKRGST